MLISPSSRRRLLRAGRRRRLLSRARRYSPCRCTKRRGTRIDPAFADAWYNLSDLLDEQGRVEAAIECLRTTLQVAPDYADAMFNLALLLQRTNQYGNPQPLPPRGEDVGERMML
jgi:tetratricopeptide (TPR) repeat protein